MSDPRDAKVKDTRTDLIDMARELYCAKIAVANREEELKQVKENLKEARKERDRILDDMAALGKTLGPVTVPLKRAS